MIGHRRLMARFCAVSLALVAIGVAFALSIWMTQVPVASAPERPFSLPEAECRGPWNGVVMTQSQLDQVIEAHGQWLLRAEGNRRRLPTQATAPYDLLKVVETEFQFAQPGYASPMPASTIGQPTDYSDEGRADLCGARILGLDFKEADLRYARLMGARIERSDMGGVNLHWSYLQFLGVMDIYQDKPSRPGSLYGAQAMGMLIYQSDFSGWSFEGAKMRFIDANDDKFSNVSFESADLTGAIFRNVDFDGARLSNTDLNHSSVNIQAGRLPQVESLRDAKNLTSISAFEGSEATLAELRNKLDSAKLSVPAAEINFALHRQSNGYEAARAKDRAYPFEAEINWALFGVPYAYGLKPGRLFIAGGAVAVIFSFFYAFAIHRSQGNREGIWVSRPKSGDRNRKSERAVRLTRYNSNPWLMGFWFSILSAFRIGWGNISVGEWIARLLPTSYEFHAAGWPRTVAGLQSLLSVYLLALAISKYLL